MDDSTVYEDGRIGRQIMAAALWVGLVSGLVEGVGWMIIQRFDRLTNLWTQVVWIAPFLNGLLFFAAGIGLAVLSRFLPRRVWFPVAGFSIAFGAAAHFLALAVQAFLHPGALFVLALGIATLLNRAFQKRTVEVLAFFGRSLKWVLATVLLVFASTQLFYHFREVRQVAALPEADADVPNVVVVIIDALRADHVSAYGYSKETSPFLDELAREGALFERTLATSPYSLPSHASLLSGLYPYEHGAEWLDFKAFGTADYPSIAESLSERGFRTGAFSANPFWFTREQGFGRGFVRFEDFYHSVPDMFYRTVFGKVFEKVLMPRLGMEQVPARREATENTDRILNWISKDDEHPFFTFINYFDVHDPYLPPQPYRSRFSAEEEPGGFLNWRLGRGESSLTPEQRQGELEAYDGAIAYVDDELRRLAEGIALMRPDEELMIIVTSDHGEAFGEHGTYLHGKSLHREEILVPLIVWWPGGVPSSVRVDRPVTHASIPSTILDLVSDGTAELYGAPSLTPLWADSVRAESWPWPLAEMGQRDWVDPAFPVSSGDIQTLASPDWQYIAHESLPELLFDWADVLQANDRAQDSEVEQALAEFRRRLPKRP